MLSSESLICSWRWQQWPRTIAPKLQGVICVFSLHRPQMAGSAYRTHLACSRPVLPTLILRPSNHFKSPASPSSIQAFPDEAQMCASMCVWLAVMACGGLWTGEDKQEVRSLPSFHHPDLERDFRGLVCRREHCGTACSVSVAIWQCQWHQVDIDW